MNNTSTSATPNTSQDTDLMTDILSNGSEWVRADFHMHTRADKEFSFDESSGNFADNYVEAMIQAEIRVGVITNHNKFDRDEFKALAKTAKKRGLLLLAGVELSVKDGANGVHTLVVFSPSWIRNEENKNYIQNFLDVTFAGQANYENENGRSKHDLNDTIRELDDFGRDYFLVFAHVEAKSGLWNEFGGGRVSELGQHVPFRNACLGFQKVRTRDTRTTIKGHLGGFYPAEVEGCDCKSIDEIGKGSKSYIKLGALTFESVKFALLDHEHRVAPHPPESQHSRIRKLVFEGNRIGDTTLNFSPEMNTLIGIRGSGKSSIIESLRYALGIEVPSNADRDGYKVGSVKHALGSGGKVTVFASDRHGTEYEIRRIVDQEPDVYIDGKHQPGISIRETILHKPMYFGQKDLSSKDPGFENDLVEKLVGQSLDDVRRQIASHKVAVAESVRRLEKHSDVGEREQEFLAKKQDAEHRLKVFKEHGVEEKLKKQVDYESDSKTCRKTTEFAERYINSLDELVLSFEEEFAEQEKYESQRNAVFFEEFFVVFHKLTEGFEQLKKVRDTAKASAVELGQKVAEFENSKNDLKEEFAEVARSLSEELKEKGASTIEPGDVLKLRQVIETATDELKTAAKDKHQQSEVHEELIKNLVALNEQRHAEFKVIKERLAKINDQETALQIEIDYRGDKDAFLQQLKSTFKGSKLREATLSLLVQNYSDGAAIYRDFENAKSLVGTSSQIFADWFNEHLTDLLSWQVPNKFTIKYHGKKLQSHSLGQRASALILFVLSQRDNDVVIIDQPEDDLDNQTIYEDVIKLVRKLKSSTQFVFATHNPNIPVLGDAEQIFACCFEDDKIESSVGSIDCPKQQEAIVRIMEGGSEAFERRRDIYRAWKQH